MKSAPLFSTLFALTGPACANDPISNDLTKESVPVLEYESSNLEASNSLLTCATDNDSTCDVWMEADEWHSSEALIVPSQYSSVPVRYESTSIVGAIRESPANAVIAGSFANDPYDQTSTPTEPTESSVFGPEGNGIFYLIGGLIAWSLVCGTYMLMEDSVFTNYPEMPVKIKTPPPPYGRFWVKKPYLTVPPKISHVTWSDVGPYLVFFGPLTALMAWTDKSPGRRREVLTYLQDCLGLCRLSRDHIDACFQRAVEDPAILQQLSTREQFAVIERTYLKIQAMSKTTPTEADVEAIIGLLTECSRLYQEGFRSAFPVHYTNRINDLHAHYSWRYDDYRYWATRKFQR